MYVYVYLPDETILFDIALWDAPYLLSGTSSGMCDILVKCVTN